jgi:hypothetical protein
MMIFPLRTINFSSAPARDLARRSIDHWLGMPSELTGLLSIPVL